MRGTEVRRVHSEKHARPRRGTRSRKQIAVLSRRQAERGSKAFWSPEQLDRHLARCRDSRVASEPMLKVETIMRALCTGQERRRYSWSGRGPGLHQDLHALVTKQLHACTSMEPTTPIFPEQRSRTDNERMQEHTHLTRLGGSAAIPLTLLAQGAETATADTVCIVHTQTPVGLPAPLGCRKRLARLTAERAIRFDGA